MQKSGKISLLTALLQPNIIAWLVAAAVYIHTACCIYKAFVQYVYMHEAVVQYVCMHVSLTSRSFSHTSPVGLELAPAGASGLAKLLGGSVGGDARHVHAGLEVGDAHGGVLALNAQRRGRREAAVDDADAFLLRGTQAAQRDVDSTQKSRILRHREKVALKVRQGEQEHVCLLAAFACTSAHT